MGEALKSVRAERTGWRDSEFDHLLMKYNISQPDSFFVTEYNYGKSVAMIEYKTMGSDTSPNDAIINYTNLRSNHEFYFIVLYDYIKNHDSYCIQKFLIYPSNKAAIEKYGDVPIEMNEKEYISFLYDIRDNNKSPYKEKALSEYEPWFQMDSCFEEDKQVISHRHRHYAYDVPAADVDGFMVDKDNIPYLFIEYKANWNVNTDKHHGHNHFIDANMNHDTYKMLDGRKKVLFNKAISDLGDGCKEKIPVIAVEYNLENKIFSLYAFNDTAAETVKLGKMYEEEYFKYICNPDNFRKKNQEQKSETICPLCGGKLEKKSGRYGAFLGCDNYRTSGWKYTKKIQH